MSGNIAVIINFFLLVLQKNVCEMQVSEKNYNFTELNDCFD